MLEVHHRALNVHDLRIPKKIAVKSIPKGTHSIQQCLIIHQVNADGKLAV